MTGRAAPSGWAAERELPTPLGPAWMHQTALPHLRPGEPLLAAIPAELDSLLPLYVDGGFERTALELVYVLTLPRFVRDAFGLAPTMNNPVGRAGRGIYRAVRRLFHRGAWSGGWTSTAGQFLVAVRTSPGVIAARPAPGVKEVASVDHDRFGLVLTDRRLLVLSRKWNLDEPYDAVALFEVPRGAFGRRGESHPSWQEYRLDLVFSDGSWIALRMPDFELAGRISPLLG